MPTNTTRLSRSLIKLRAEMRRKMRALCTDFNPQPLIEMTSEEVKAFATRLAAGAQVTVRLTEGGRRRGMDESETAAYVAAVSDSIAYFNSRDAEHSRLLLYREECRRMEAEKRMQREKQRREGRNCIVIHFA